MSVGRVTGFGVPEFAHRIRDVAVGSNEAKVRCFFFKEEKGEHRAFILASLATRHGIAACTSVVPLQVGGEEESHGEVRVRTEQMFSPDCAACQ